MAIRAYQSRDAPTLFEGVAESIAELKPWMLWVRDGYSRQDAEQFLRNAQHGWESGTDYEFAILDERSGQLLGGIDIHGINARDHIGEIGYWVRSSRTGLGVAPAATRLAARLGFEDLQLERIEIMMAVENYPSRRVAEKAGASLEGMLKRRLRLHDVQHDAYLFALFP